MVSLERKIAGISVSIVMLDEGTICPIRYFLIYYYVYVTLSALEVSGEGLYFFICNIFGRSPFGSGFSQYTPACLPAGYLLQSLTQFVFI